MMHSFSQWSSIYWWWHSHWRTAYWNNR